ncbi:fibroblast growth factor receptor 3-like [Ptychodera flava]|uniref:fibroblast growth factor receptor 3-like n=1 Tax=Ptychodera flava TaxID=63121 RepID=UPI00396A725B
MRRKNVVEKHEFPRQHLIIRNELGSGHFGVVYEALALKIGKNGESMIVAAKMLKDDANSDQMEDLLREIITLQEIGTHPNILRMLGCCTADKPYILMTEYMKYGDLLNFLRKTKEPTYENKLSDPTYELKEVNYYQIARQIARGMNFLAQQKYVHGDLAARNVLVGDDLLVKISDFGLANDVYLQGWTAWPSGRRRAAKWVSLETNLEGLCTIQSDVWSFGIVLYEIVTQGETPYPGMSAASVVTSVKEGYRMPKPKGCRESVYAIMQRCWRENPKDRPQFKVLIQEFDHLLSQFADYINEPLPKVVNNDDSSHPLTTCVIDHKTDYNPVPSRDTGNEWIRDKRNRRRKNYSVEESALGESTSTHSFDDDDNFHRDSDIEDFSDTIVFEATSDSGSDEGFGL